MPIPVSCIVHGVDIRGVGLERCQSYQAPEVMTGKLLLFMIDSMQPFPTQHMQED